MPARLDAKKARVLILNNYSFDRVWAEVRRGHKPAHHLYAIDHLEEHGYEVRILPLKENRVSDFWSQITHRLRPLLGDIGQQWRAWKLRNECDMIYAPTENQTQVLSYLRAVGLFGIPILTVAHHPLVRGRFSALRRFFARWQTRGVDAYPALSQGLADEINALCGDSAKSRALHWGPDLDFYSAYANQPGIGAFAAGRTGRDFCTLHKAAIQGGTAVRIVCLANDSVVSRAADNPSEKITVIPVRTEAHLGYRELLPQMAAARVHAIPLVEDPSLAGLTSLTDALALGKPVIMTRHRLIDIDLESEGIGRWVAVGDVQGWTKALKWFECHPDEALAMGRRARLIAESPWNYHVFAREIEANCRRLLKNAS